MNIGEQIGPYRIESLLGKGGMAEVYKAFQTGLHRAEALKALPPQMTLDKTFVERFLNEARTAASLQHPHIAAIYAVSEADAPQPYFTMELVESGDLSDFIAAHAPMALDEALPILAQIASALDYAHAQGVLHRDIKPGNILLKPDGNGGWDVKVVDFGIARAQEDAGGTRLTKTGMIIGTPEYMSPEQGGSGAKVDARTDQYALGIVAYEMLCGVPPFKAQSDTSPISLIMQHVRDEPRAPVAHNPQLSKAANNAILKALAKEPEQRFTSCAEFAETLAGSKVVAPPSSPREKRRVEAKKFPLVPALIGISALAGVGLIAFGLGGGLKTAPEVAPPPVAIENVVETTPEVAPVAEYIEVPSLSGMSASEVRAALQSKSLQAEVLTGESLDVPQGKVIGQSPTAYQAVQTGQSVRVRISTGPPPLQTFRSSQFSFSVQAPPGWSRSEKYYSDDNRTRIKWDAPASRVSFLVDVIPGAGSGSPLADFQDADQRKQAGNGSRYQRLSLGSDTLDGQEAARWDFILNGVKKVDISANYSGNGYALLCSAPVGSYDQWQDEFDGILRSFKFGGG